MPGTPTLEVTFETIEAARFRLICRDSIRELSSEPFRAFAKAKQASYFDICEISDPAESKLHLLALGRDLYQWLDGNERWLSRTTDPCDLILNLTADPRSANARLLSHLPWEILADNDGFLVQRGWLPIRLVNERAAAAAPNNRPLRVLFLAASPENVDPLLDFEREESQILAATKEQPLALRVEDSGSLAGLRRAIDDHAAGDFDVLHLNGHGYIGENEQPHFVMEDEVGQRKDATASDLGDAVDGRWPAVVFVSACHTAEQPNQGTAVSFIQSVVEQGAMFGLGWARPISDNTAILFAKALFDRLSTGRPVTDAVRTSHKAMRECLDWHLLRCFTSQRVALSLVTPQNTAGRAIHVPPHPEATFLDTERRLKVAPANLFVGRRRPLQRSLGALDYTNMEADGVFLAGLGGLGKSSLAARLCRRLEERHEGLHRLVLFGLVTEANLRRVINDAFADNAAVRGVMEKPDLSFEGQLRQMLDHAGYRVLFVLDDFERNQPRAADGDLRLTAESFDAVQALTSAIAHKPGRAKLILTCRYSDLSVFPPLRLHHEHLPGMTAGEVTKRARLTASDDSNPQRLNLILSAAAGNPRLLDWLLALQNRPDIIDDAFLEQIRVEQERLRTDLLARRLFGSLTERERELFARLTIFQIPVDAPVLTALGFATRVHERPLALGLLEPSDEGLLVPEILHDVCRNCFNELDRWKVWMMDAGTAIHQAWWANPLKCRTVQALEILRLSCATQAIDVSVDIAERIANNWVVANRFTEALALILAVEHGIGQHYRLTHQRARAEKMLGKGSEALEHYLLALNQCPDHDLAQRAALTHNLAVLREQRGEFEEALELYDRAIEMQDLLKDVRGKPAAFQAIAGIRVQQSELDKAMDFYHKALHENGPVGDVHVEAAVLLGMADVLRRQGKPSAASELCLRSMKLSDGISDDRGKATALLNLGILRMHEGDGDGAMALYRRSIAIYDAIRDASGKVAVLLAIGDVWRRKNDELRAMDYYSQALHISEAIGDGRGKAAALSRIAKSLEHE